jgi:hypothetical protein
MESHNFPHSEDNANLLRGVMPRKVVTGFVPRPKGPGFSTQEIAAAHILIEAGSLGTVVMDF